MTDSTRFYIDLDQGKHTYCGGELVHGLVVLDLNEDMPARGVWLTLLGRETAVGSMGVDGRFADTFTDSREIVHDEVILHGRPMVSLKEVAQEAVANIRHQKDPFADVLPAGTYRWPFKLHLPQNCPGDYVSKHGSSISYVLTAHVGVPFHKDFVTTQQLHVYEPVLERAHSVAVHANKEFLFDSHPLKLDVSLPAQLYAVGAEISNIDVRIHNESRKVVRSIKAALWKREEVRPEGAAFEHLFELAESKSDVDVAGPSEHHTKLALRIPERTYASVTMGKLLTVSHFVRVTVDIPWATDFHVDIPIRLVDVPANAAHPRSLRPPPQSVAISTTTSLAQMRQGPVRSKL